MTITVDQKCYDLAEDFLSETRFKDNSALISELAIVIQEVIEDFLKELEEEEEEEEDE